MATQSVEIVVPDGLRAGDDFEVQWGGVGYSIAVPDGVSGGQALTIELPALEETGAGSASSQSATASVEIVVPDGLAAGDNFEVEWGGVSYSIAVPDGVSGGQALTIELPSIDPAAEPSEPADTGAPSVDATKGDSKEGQPMIPVEGATGATWTDIDCAIERLEQTCTERCTDKCPRCDGYGFKPGQRIEVYRTDGAMSPGHIVGKGWEGFDGPTYKVQLDDGLCKEAVPEDDLSAEVCDVGELF